MSRRSRSQNSSKSSKQSNKKQQSKHKDERRQRSGSQSSRKSQQQQNACLYIGNLDRRCPQEKLKEICEQYGQFDYCYIVFEPSSPYDKNKEAKISRGYGFVKYKTNAQALKARQGLNGLQIMSRKISVQISKRTRPRESTPGKYLGRRRSPPRRESRGYRRRSYSRSSSGDYRRRRKHSSQREKKHRDHKESKRRDRSRSGQKKHKKRRQSRSNSPRK